MKYFVEVCFMQILISIKLNQQESMVRISNQRNYLVFKNILFFVRINCNDFSYVRFELKE